MILVFEIHHEQQAEQQHDAVLIHIGEAGFGVGFLYGPPHDFKQRIFTRIAVDHRLEVFLHRQRKVVGGGDSLLDGADLASLGRLSVGIAAKEKGKQGQTLRLFNGIFQRPQPLQIELDEGFLGGDLVGVIHPPDTAVG